MKTTTLQIAKYVELVRQNKHDEHFFHAFEVEQLMEAYQHFMEAYRNEPDARVRSNLVYNIWWAHHQQSADLLKDIWQSHEQSVIPFLGEALHDAESIVWQEALDGLVSLASPAALDVLRSARMRHLSSTRDTEEFRSWLEEAIVQAEAEAQRV